MTQPPFDHSVPPNFPSAVVSPRIVPPRTIPPIHIILFGATLLTTTLAGTFQAGGDPLSDPFALVLGLPFALTLLLILLSHEMGHYILARIHGVWASLPYFIPGPPFFVGTFGAFIRMKSAPANRSALFDIGAAGPWAGVCFAIPAVIIGLTLSEVRPLDPLSGGIILGDSVLFSSLIRLVLGVTPDEVRVILHPIALAGWFGLFVTFLNLLPVGQLDGGHVVYSLFGPAHRWVARAFLLLILVLGFQGWNGWFVWVVLLAILGIDHPPTDDQMVPLDRKRTIYGWCTVGLFVLTFTPVPITISADFPLQEDVTPVAYQLEHRPRSSALPAWTLVYQP